MNYLNNRIYCYLLITTVLLCISCNTNFSKDNASDAIKINVSELIKQKPIRTNLSQIADSCKYVFLETTDDCLIDKVRFLFLTKQYIIITGRKDCFVFDRDTGKFIRRIGQYGPGPNEYSGIIRHAFLDEENEKFYMLSRDLKLLSYNINDGELIHVVRDFTKHYKSTFHDLDLIDSIHYIGNIYNSSGNFKDRFISGTIYGDSIHAFPNHISFQPKDHYDPESKKNVTYGTNLTSEMHFYHFKDKFYLKELLNDTLFYVKDPYTLIPKIVFDAGKYQFLPDLRSDALKLNEEISNYIITKQIFESDDYLFMLATYQDKVYGILYNKETGINCLVADKNHPFGFSNDIINGLPPFWPKFENNSGEMSIWYNPSELKEFLEENKLSNVSGELRNKIEHLTDDDNPVIVIVK
jgi:hypothetical protein